MGRIPILFNRMRDLGRTHDFCFTPFSLAKSLIEFRQAILILFVFCGFACDFLFLSIRGFQNFVYNLVRKPDIVF